MINGKHVAVVMPAYNAEKTLEKTVAELTDLVDIKILVDDSSTDQTAELSKRLDGLSAQRSQIIVTITIRRDNSFCQFQTTNSR